MKTYILAIEKGMEKCRKYSEVTVGTARLIRNVKKETQTDGGANPDCCSAFFW